MSLLLLLLAFAEPKWVTENTEVYRPLVSAEIAITQKGEIYMVSRDEHKILHYSSDGRLIKSFGSKGKGPGEFSMPTWLYLNGDTLYVEDAGTNTISAFTRDGRFLKRTPLPLNGTVLVPVFNGWVYGDWASGKPGPVPAKLFWSDAQFENAIELMSWQRSPEPNLTVIERTGNKKPVVPFNPSKEFSFSVSSPDGKYVYVVKNQSANIEVIDVAQKKQIKTVANPLAAIPFNEEWGDHQYENAKESLPPAIKNAIDLKKAYPDHFPLVHGLEVLPDGQLYLKLWSAKPDQGDRIQIYDQDLKQKTTTIDHTALNRIVAQFGQWYYVLIYEEEEGKIACVHQNKVNDYVANTPIEFDGLDGNSIIKH